MTGCVNCRSHSWYFYLFSAVAFGEEDGMAAKGVANSPTDAGITAELPEKPTTTSTTTITPTTTTTEATSKAGETTKMPVKQQGKKKNPQEWKEKATSTKDEARLRQKNRFVIPGRDSDDVGDPEDLSPNNMGEAEKMMTDFEERVLARMPTRQVIHQLSQESQIPEDKVYEEEKKKAEVVVLALSELEEAFPALPDGILVDEEMPAAAVIGETIPTTSSPPPAAPSFADRVSTLSASIGDLKDFSVETFVTDCHNLNAKAWNGVTGIQVISSRKILEIAFADTESMASLQLNGLNTHGRHVVFQPDSPQVICVTFWNISLEMPSKDVDVVLQKYGTIKHSFRSRKMLQTRNVHTGARVYFFELKSHVPRSLTIGGKHVKSKYTGQQTHIAEDRADKERVRSEKKTVGGADGSEACRRGGGRGAHKRISSSGRRGEGASQHQPPAPRLLFWPRD